MKRSIAFFFFILIICTLVLPSTIKADNLVNLRQDSVCTYVFGNNSYTNVYVYSPISDIYNLHLWLMGVRHSDDSYSNYLVSVDNNSLGSVSTDRGDWYAYTPNNSVYLSAGYHVVTLQGTLDDVPNVEPVTNTPDVTEYNNWKNLHRENQLIPYPYPASDYQAIDYYPYGNSQTSPPFYYSAELNKEVFYTFRRLEYYVQGQTITCSTSSTIKNVVHVFNVNNPSSSATSVSTDAGNASMSYIIPETGFYNVLVRSYSPDEWGTCNLTINGDRIFEKVPICCSYTPIVPPESGVTFSCFVKGDGDPMLMLMNSGYGGGMVNYNDDYPYDSTTSGFDWGNNSRIDQLLSDGQWAFTASSKSSSFMTKCDIYTGCEIYRAAINYCDVFPEFHEEDMICSFPASDVNYNCFSWAMGEWCFQLTTNDSLPNQYIDGVLAAYGFLETTDLHSSVDLWAIERNDGVPLYTHMSIKSKGNSYAAGYDWESKLGLGPRMFHPRYALRLSNQSSPYYNASYGDVIAHYRKGILINPVLLNFEFTGDEIDFIENHMKTVDSFTQASYFEKYAECAKKGEMIASIFLERYEEVDSYSELLKLCQANDKIEYLLFRQILKGENLAVKLLKDIVKEGEYAGIWKEVCEHIHLLCQGKKESNIIYNAQTQGQLLVKMLISKKLANQDGYSFRYAESYSDKPVFDLTAKNGKFYISFDLESAALTSVIVGTVDGSMITPILNKEQLSIGHHTFSYATPKSGYYTVAVIINGCTYKRKIYFNKNS